MRNRTAAVLKMQRSLVSLVVVLVPLLGLCSLALSQDSDHRNNSSPAKSTANFDPHDLSGIWVSRGGGVGRSPALPPFTAWGKAKYESFKPSFGPRAIPPSLGNDPLGLCDPLGIPRMISTEIFYGDSRMQFVQTPGRMLQLIQWTHVWRDIWMDGRALPSEPVPRWMGYSVGKWEGNDFVIESVGFDERTWLDELGDPHSDQMRLQERYHRADYKTLNVTMTIDDPKAYTKPWNARPVVYDLNPDPKAELEEIFCVPSEEQAFNKTIRDAAGGTKDKH